MPAVPDSPGGLQTVRVVCISDTHNANPADGAFKLPKGDVLIHAGDLTTQGTYRELQKTLSWIKNADYAAKIVIAGNHDLTLDIPFYTEHGATIHNQDPQDPIACRDLVQTFCREANIVYLEHTSVTVSLTTPDNLIVPIRVFGSPYTPLRIGSTGPAAEGWAFKYPYPASNSISLPSTSTTKPDRATQLWAQIPLDTDIVVTHTPAYTHVDTSRTGQHLGCDALRKALWRVRPRLALSGHIHEGRGAEIVRWDLSLSRLATPGMGNVDATTANGQRRDQMALKPYFEILPNQVLDLATVAGSKTSKVDATELDNDGGSDAKDKDGYGAGSKRTNDNDRSHEWDERAAIKQAIHPTRQGRKETLFVNAALKARSWGVRGPKVWNAPIVVDLKLPAYEICDPTDDTTYLTTAARPTEPVVPGSMAGVGADIDTDAETETGTETEIDKGTASRSVDSNAYPEPTPGMQSRHKYRASNTDQSITDTPASRMQNPAAAVAADSDLTQECSSSGCESGETIPQMHYVRKT